MRLGVDVVVSNAGFGGIAPFAQLSAERFKEPVFRAVFCWSVARHDPS
jgi:short-subunit dehydrogenase